MPYKPGAVTEEERSRAYPYMWFAAASSVINLGLVAWGVEHYLFGVIWGFTLGGLVMAAFSTHVDEFMRARLNMAMRFVVGAIAIGMFGVLLMTIFDLGHSVGYAVGSGEASEASSSKPAVFADAMLLCSVLCTVFYAGYVFAVIRESIGR